MKIDAPYATVARAAGDTMGVLRHARPANAVQWLGGLISRAPEIVRQRSLRPADEVWLRGGAAFRTAGGRTVRLPGDLTAGAREMYCRNVYLTTGLTIPDGGWVIDLGANAGLFTVLAAVAGARVVAVEAQRGFVPEIQRLLALNGIEPGRVHIEVAMAGSADPAVAEVGVLVDEERWRTASHADARRPAWVSVPELLARRRIDRVGMIKMDIEGSEFSLLHPANELSWLDRIDQIAMEVHPQFGDVVRLCRTLSDRGFTTRLTTNDGDAVSPAQPTAAYLYCHRGATANRSAP